MRYFSISFLAVTAVMALSSTNAAGAPAFGTVFRDCPDCPEMVVVPPGTFNMGSPATDGEADAEEQPQRQVMITTAFAVGRAPVTFAEWDVCVSDGWCPKANDKGWGRGNRPVINVNWDDAQQFLGWLRFKSGKVYRLPEETEFEYFARAGTSTRYWWGNTVGVNNANCRNCSSAWDNRMTAPVTSFKANPFGLADTQGNVWQWMQDCWRSEKRAPQSTDNCEFRVVRGGAWNRKARSLRSANRARMTTIGRTADVGFRVVRNMAP